MPCLPREPEQALSEAVARRFSAERRGFAAVALPGLRDALPCACGAAKPHDVRTLLHLRELRPTAHLVRARGRNSLFSVAMVSFAGAALRALP